MFAQQQLPSDKKHSASQFQVLQIVCDRIHVETNEFVLGQPGSSEPISLLVLGDPGTGKSYVIHSLVSMFKSLGWTADVEFIVMAFQAVTAEAIGGDTMHHCSDIRVGTPYNHSSSNKKDKHKCRWGIVDEISQVQHNESLPHYNVRSASI